MHISCEAKINVIGQTIYSFVDFGVNDKEDSAFCEISIFTICCKTLLICMTSKATFCLTACERCNF